MGEIRTNHGTIDHRVVNAHGSNLGMLWIGKDGFDSSPSSLNLWRPLHGLVRYIWFMNCNMAFFPNFLSTVAEYTGARVSGFMGRDLIVRHVADCIEYQYLETMTHFDGASTPARPLNPRAFFRLGRRQAIASLSLDAMDFNLIPRQNCVVPPYRGP